jgi:hypothetical protein
MSTKFCLFWLLVLRRDFGEEICELRMACEEVCEMKMACEKVEVGVGDYQRLTAWSVGTTRFRTLRC